MESLTAALQSSILFSGFPESVVREEILPLRQIREYPKDRFVLEPLRQEDRFGILLSGRVHIMHILPDGQYSLMTALAAGDVLGADLICTRSRVCPYHAVAASPAKIAYFPSDMLTEPGTLTESWRQSAVSHLLTLISHENMKKEYRLAILSRKGLRERIATYLLMQARRRGENTFAISFSREELANYLCVNRSALSHELSLMQQEGLITFRKNIFTLEGLGEPVPFIGKEGSVWKL